MAVHTYNPSSWETGAEDWLESEASWGYRVRRETVSGQTAYDSLDHMSFLHTFKKYLTFLLKSNTNFELFISNRTGGDF